MDEPQKQEPSLSKSASTVGLLTIASKLAGLVRDLMIAAAYGAGPLSDAYNSAYLFTGNILILFGGLGGPFHSATVVTLKPRKEDPNSGLLVVQILAATGVILFLATLVVFAAAPDLVHRLADNYGHGNLEARSRYFSETVNQLRWMSPLIVLSGLIGVTYGVLNVFNKFFWPSVSPAIASLAIIIALLIYPNPHNPALQTSLPLAIGTVVGAFGQLFAQLPDMSKCKLQYKFSFKPTPELRNYLAVLWPAFIGTSIGQLTVYVDWFFSASCKDGAGAWTAISNANRLIQLPLGVLITAMVVPLLPRFTQHASNERPDLVKGEFIRAVRFMWFVSAPLMMILIVLAHPIVETLYQRHNWTIDDTRMVTIALEYMAPSIILYIGRDLISRVFYAYEDSRTPYYIGIGVLFLKGIMDYLFVIVLNYGIAGISLATSLITVFNFSCLSFLLSRKIGPLGLKSLIKPAIIMTFACVIAGIASDWINVWLSPFIDRFAPGSLPRSIALAGSLSISGGIGLAIYTGITISCKLEEPLMLLRRLKLLPAADQIQ